MNLRRSRWILAGSYHWEPRKHSATAGGPAALSVLAYTLSHTHPRLALRQSVQHWSERSIEVKLMESGDNKGISKCLNMHG